MGDAWHLNLVGERRQVIHKASPYQASAVASTVSDTSKKVHVCSHSRSFQTKQQQSVFAGKIEQITIFWDQGHQHLSVDMSIFYPRDDTGNATLVQRHADTDV